MSMLKQYLGHIIWCIYVTDLKYIWLAMGALIALWIIFGLVGMKKFPWAWRTLNKIGCICSIAAIIYLTVADRSTGYRVPPDFIPFHFVIEAKEQVEMWRTALMNVFLFVPFGITFPFAITGKKHSAKKKDIILATILIATLISVSIESYQYFFSMGRCEIDDMLCNTFGAILGTFSYILV